MSAVDFGSEAARPAAPAEPFLQVVSGNPTDEELAALTAVVIGLGAASPEADPAHGTSPERDPARTRRAWTRRRALSLQPLPGPGSWRRSYR
ncbi:acyl-CoA carboxylase subunit epsilon [Arthrobacter gandavensis]|uniref:acyl-CoA carboxylase subunit epsilon n=1 Tax=Arthrobacter gandavensis TaxID=169960 RepID=UPI00188F6779|nr:acyl-CoA carboxylase subunit epsilon [Arthrobacter gandavensis]MBF4992962.1 acyl-CoA carboxylase subunit epsilon [Arthrobacter gandavensis]